MFGSEAGALEFLDCGVERAAKTGRRADAREKIECAVRVQIRGNVAQEAMEDRFVEACDELSRLSEEFFVECVERAEVDADRAARSREPMGKGADVRAVGQDHPDGGEWTLHVAAERLDARDAVFGLAGSGRSEEELRGQLQSLLRRPLLPHLDDLAHDGD